MIDIEEIVIKIKVQNTERKIMYLRVLNIKGEHDE